MKLAFLFLTRGNLNKMSLWRNFFKGVDKNLYNIYVHPKTNNIDKFLYPHIIPECIETQWGNISLVKATILLLKEALKDDKNRKFILLSESCIPIRSFKNIYQRMSGTTLSFIYYFWGKDPTSQKRYRQMTGEHNIPSDKFLKQSQWMILDRVVVPSIINNDMTQYYDKMLAPDEHYFINLLYLRGRDIFHRRIKNHKITYVDLRNRVSTAHPNTYEKLTSNDIKMARRDGCLFMRKISNKCIIDERLTKILLEQVK